MAWMKKLTQLAALLSNAANNNERELLLQHLLGYINSIATTVEAIEKEQNGK